MTTPELISRAEDLAPLAARLAAAEVVAIDSEGNGLHAYRPRVCTVQLSWHDRACHVVVVDTLALDLAPLREALGPSGPIKVLHDLTFDARMLAERGIEIGRVRDTSVAARFLGEPAIGLAALLASRLGITIDKGLQGHDWGRRPLGEGELAYLASDVQHLLDLDRSLQKDAERLGISSEIEVECAYKLRCALAPPKHGGPAPARVKGYRELPPEAQALFCRLWLERERVAELEDRPAHRIAPAGLLLAIARARPRTEAALRRIGGAKLGGQPQAWLAALRSDEPEPLAAVDGAPVAPPPNALSRHLDAALARWRRSAAAARGIDPQVVMPGHCMTALARLLTEGGDDRQLLERMRGIEGVCAGRVDRYGAELCAIARQFNEKKPLNGEEPR